MWHGTSNKIKIHKNKLIPPIHSNVLREDFRIKNIDVVFLSVSKVSAEFYARRASEKFGGKPIVYKAVPNDIICRNGTEIMCGWANITGIA